MVVAPRGMAGPRTKKAALGMGRRSRMQVRGGRWRVQAFTPDGRREGRERLAEFGLGRRAGVGARVPGEDEPTVGVREVIAGSAVAAAPQVGLPRVGQWGQSHSAPRRRMTRAWACR